MKWYSKEGGITCVRVGNERAQCGQGMLYYKSEKGKETDCGTGNCVLSLQQH